MKRDWVEPGDCRPLCPSENIRAVVLKAGVLKSVVLASSGNLLERLTHWSPTLWAFITLWIVPRFFCMVSISVPEKGLGWSLQPLALQLLCITGCELGEEGRVVTRRDTANEDGDWWEKDTERKAQANCHWNTKPLETMWPKTSEWQPPAAPILCSSTIPGGLFCEFD